MRLKRVYVIRHGQTDWNMLGRWQGFEQISLNNEGLNQAQALANYLQTQPITAIYTSDLSRALQTATALSEALKITPQIDPRWRERNLGIFQGMTRAEIYEKFPEEMNAMQTDRYNYIIPNGESQKDVQKRAYEAWEQVIRHAPGPEAAIISHGGTIKTLLLKLFDNDPALADVNLTNTSITTLEHNGSEWIPLEVAATPHLILIRPDVTEEGNA